MRLAIVVAWILFVCDAAPAAAAEAAAPLDSTYHDVATRLIGDALESDHAWLRLSQLCDGIGNRLSGSESLQRATRWAQEAMREDGLDRAWLQPVMVPHWVRGEERAEMVEPGPQRLEVLGLGRSVGTPQGGLTAEVVAVGSFAELDALPADAVRGKIVLYDVPFTHYGETVRYRSDGAKRAAVRGAVAVLLRSVGPVSLRTPHTGAMSAYNDSFPKIPAAAVPIEDAAMLHRLLDQGRRVRVHLEMGAKTLPDVLSHNVIGEIRGRERPDEVVVVGGHLDSWDVGQGAMDDGGGCVASMEVLRLFKQLGLRPRRTVRCVLWTNEENGLRGGAAYRDSLGDATSKHIAAIEIDGGVERPTGFGVSVRRAHSDSLDAPRQARALVQARQIGALLAGLGADQITAGGGGADISPLSREGVPSLGHRTIGEHYFDWHHTPADMMDKVDPVELRKNVAVLAVMVYVLADMPEPLGGAAAAPVATPLPTH
jgi:carboxypeptidase Q